MTYNHDVFSDATEDKCQACKTDERELRSFDWGHIQFTVCELCANDIRKRLAFGIRQQHAYHESEFLGVKA